MFRPAILNHANAKPLGGNALFGNPRLSPCRLGIFFGKDCDLLFAYASPLLESGANGYLVDSGANGISKTLARFVVFNFLKQKNVRIDFTDHICRCFDVFGLNSRASLVRRTVRKPFEIPSCEAERAGCPDAGKEQAS